MPCYDGLKGIDLLNLGISEVINPIDAAMGRQQESNDEKEA